MEAWLGVAVVVVRCNCGEQYSSWPAHVLEAASRSGRHLKTRRSGRQHFHNSMMRRADRRRLTGEAGSPYVCKQSAQCLVSLEPLIYGF